MTKYIGTNDKIKGKKKGYVHKLDIIAKYFIYMLRKYQQNVSILIRSFSV